MKSGISILLLIVSFYSWGQFITDKLSVPMRSGDSNKYRIISFLKAGTKITVLENLPSNYSYITNQNGRSGYILTEYIVSKEPASKKLPDLKKELAEKNLSIKEMEVAISEKNSQIQSLEEKNGLMSLNIDKTENKLEEILNVSENALNLQKRVKELEIMEIELTSENERLLAKNLAAEDDKWKAYFLYGASAMLIGTILGLILPRLRNKRIESSW